MLNAEASVERQKPELSGFVDRYRPPHQCDPVSVPAAAVSCGVRARSRSPLQAAVVIRRLLVHDDANVDPRIPAAAHVCRARGTQRRHVHVLSIETNKLPQLRQRQTASHRIVSSPSLGGADLEFWTPSNTWFLDPTRVGPEIGTLAV